MPGEVTESSRTIPMTKDSGTGKYQDWPVDPNGNPKVSVQGSQYQDLGQVLTAGAIAAGAIVNSPWYAGLQWVRNIDVMAQIDTAGWSVIAYRGDSGVTNPAALDWGTQIGSSSTSVGTSSWASVTASGASGLGAYQMRFGLKNTTASASTVGNLRVQLMGL